MYALHMYSLNMNEFIVVSGQTTTSAFHKVVQQQY